MRANGGNVNTKRMEESESTLSEEVIQFEVYIAGGSVSSKDFLRNFRERCEKHLSGRYHIEVIDVLTNPGVAERERVLATPTLVKKHPAPMTRIVGQPSDWESFMEGIRNESLEPRATIDTTAANAEEDEFNKMVEDLKDGIIVLNHEGVIRYANPAAESLMGRTSQDLIGLHFGSPIPGDEKIELALVVGKSPIPIAELNITETVWRGEKAFVTTIRDISSHKDQTNKARDAVGRRDRFFATLAHELRNPLSAIGNVARIMAHRAEGDEESLQLSDVLSRQCNQMSRLLDDVSQLSRIVQGKFEIRKRAVDLERILDTVIETAQPVMEQRHHEFIYERPENPVVLYVDQSRIQQAVANLLTNAAKYTPKNGKIRLWTKTTNEEVSIGVTDNGTGIPAKEMELIFELFHQSQHNQEHVNSGLGIGLSMVKNMVELHDGHLTVESAGVNRGSEFVIKLPTTERKAARKAKIARRSHQLSIVVVEDNTDVRDMLRALLELEGHEVFQAADGPEGIEVIKRRKPDVALIDLGLPGCSGHDVAAAIQELPDFENTFLVALTGFGRESDSRDSKASGFHEYLVKPVDFNNLVRLMNRFMKKRQ